METQKKESQASSSRQGFTDHLGPRFMMLFIAFAIAFWYVIDMTREDIMGSAAEKPVVHKMKTPTPGPIKGAAVGSGALSQWTKPLTEEDDSPVKMRRASLAERFDRAVELAGGN